MADINTIWLTKIRNANKYYTQWEDRFRCKQSEEYYESYQWRNIIDVPYYKPYVVNLVYAEIKKKLANILYQNLEYVLTPRPGNYGYNPEFAMMSAQTKQDFLNEIISRANQENDFNDACKLVAMDSYFRFGVMEIGYAADWRNPNKTPILTSNYSEDIDEVNPKVIEDLDLPENERIYFKRIKASRFRVSTSDDHKLRNCSWCGYYTYIYKDVLANTKGIKLPSDFDSDWSADYVGHKADVGANRASSDSKDMLELMKKGKVCKVWHIFDNEEKTRNLVLDNNYNLIWSKPLERLPFATHRHDFRFDGWYPVPPVYHWLSPQDEVNQAREQMRNYRKRFTRKFMYWGIDQEEIEKFKSEIDGEIIKKKSQQGGIEAIGNPEIGISIQEGLNAGRDDFNLVSGSSSDLSSVQKDRTTATQSKITAMKAEAIENVEQLEFAKFYKKIGRLTLLEARENFATGIWVKNSLNPGEGFLNQLDPLRSSVFKYVTTQDLNDGFDVDYEINCINGTPEKMQEMFEKFVKFQTMLMQFPHLALDPTLIRESAYICGYRNEKVIASIQKAALLAMLGQAQNAATNSGNDLNSIMGNGNGAANNMIRNAAPAGTEAMNNQLINQ